MREHLLGYLTGALEPHETEQVESRLGQDDQLRQDLEAMRLSVQPLAADAGHFEPPVGLAKRTCDYVASCMTTPAVRVSGGSLRRWTVADLLVAACVLVAGTLVFFPAVSYSRYNSQLAGCQNNLRQIGMGLLHYSSNHNGYLPQLPTRGNEAVAGLYAPILVEGGYLDSGEYFVCPAMPLDTGTADSWSAGFRMPTRAELRAATGERLRAMQRRLGGTYGYNLGYVEGQRYQPVRPRGRSTFALVADAPSPALDSSQSGNHRGRGQNVLFEDGHVGFLNTCRACPQTNDDVFHNDDGEVAAGKHLNDAVIGPSDVPPLGFDAVE